jgi:AmiR/NasT family two-component response regulator
MASIEERDGHPAPAPPHPAAVADPVMVAHAEQIATLTQQVDQLSAAVESNRIIGAAIGIVMERLQLDRAAAFMYLVRRSQDANQKLSSVAQDLVLKVERNASRS